MYKKLIITFGHQWNLARSVHQRIIIGLLFSFFFFFFLVFWDRVSLCNSPNCPGTSSFKLGWPRTHRDSRASDSRVLGLKLWASIDCFVLVPLLGTCLNKRTLFGSIEAWKNKDTIHTTVVGWNFKDYSDPQITGIYFSNSFSISINWGSR